MQRITTEKEFINPVTEMEWTSEGVQQEGATQTIIYRDEDTGTYCRMLRFPEGFNEGVVHAEGGGCCFHDFDEMVFVVSGGVINRRLGYRYHPGTIAVFPNHVDHGPLEAPFGTLLLEFRHYRKTDNPAGLTTEKEFINPVTEMEWTSEGVQQEGATQTIIYRDEDTGTYCRMLRFPEGFNEGVAHAKDEGCCFHDFDEMVFVVSGGVINRRLGYRYHPGTIAVFPKEISHGPLEAPFGCLLLEFRHFRK
jgi:hypothetical protein